jgi:dCTP diphosphatase
MTQLEAMTQRIQQFRDARDWKQFHNPKDIALSMMLEAGEVAEHFQWMNADEMRQHAAANKDAIGEELADVLYWVLLLSADLKIDLAEAFDKKLKINESKYPADKARGRHTKYDKL